ncbi:gamma-glutamylcyclotransferase [Trichocoleus sp. FACHB-591]|uniref:gamma-glutamylcyclotransferase family protein n=1 Tax=Trichocoleus sp. FACHB-591 TaxID=2692872 RepID=UPI0018EFC590|nr:gamma-glutamylcyclotransferase [Trichocoleus sp. FACHB-591]
MDFLKVFVYGTLKPGEVNYQRYCAGKVVTATPAIARGQLFALPLGYPAMTWGTQTVHGFLLSFQDTAILSRLDALEDFVSGRSPEQNEYQREVITVFDSEGQPLGRAWAYLMHLHHIQQLRGVLIPDGIWLAQARPS